MTHDPRRSNWRQLVSMGALTAALGGCGSPSSPSHPTPPPPSGPPVPQVSAAPESSRQPPPEAGPAPITPFPRTQSQTLPNGLGLAVVPNSTLPIVQMRLVVKAGTETTSGQPELARLSALMLKDGGTGNMASAELLRRIESLGTDLDVRVTQDSTVLSLAVTRDHFEEALRLLSAVVRSPRWDGAEFKKLKVRELQRVTDLAKSSGHWSAQMALYRHLYRSSAGMHPYATPDATRDQVARVELAACRAFHQKHHVPANSLLVIAGDVQFDRARNLVEAAFSGWQGSAPPTAGFVDAEPIDRISVVLVDRPESTQSDILVGALGPSRRDPIWPALAVANQVLGGGVSGRLFLELREKQSLAYSTGSSLGELGHAPVPITLYAGTQTSKTGLAVQGLLEQVARLSEPPPETDVERARRFLVDVFAVRMETIGSVADMLVNLRSLGLPDDYYDSYRRELRSITPAQVADVARRHLGPGKVVVAVAGDASRLGPMLAHFGQVSVVDPMRNFERKRLIEANPSAPLELEPKRPLE